MGCMCMCVRGGGGGGMCVCMCVYVCVYVCMWLLTTQSRMHFEHRTSSIHHRPYSSFFDSGRLPGFPICLYVFLHIFLSIFWLGR